MTTQPSGPPPSDPRSGGDSSVKAAKWAGGLSIVGLIGAAVVTQVLGLWHWGGAQQSNAPLRISITSPTQYVSPVGNVFSGTIQGLQPGQTIWVFSKQMTDRKGPITSGVVTMNEGRVMYRAAPGPVRMWELAGATLRTTAPIRCGQLSSIRRMCGNWRTPW